MKKDIRKPEMMRELQGDLVLVVVGDEEYIFTIVRFMDGPVDKLQLVNRAERGTDPPMEFTQAVFDNLVPIKHEQAKWKLTL